MLIDEPWEDIELPDIDLMVDLRPADDLGFSDGDCAITADEIPRPRHVSTHRLIVSVGAGPERPILAVRTLARLTSWQVLAIRSSLGSMEQNNVFGEPLEVCSVEPLTGFYRDGYCNTGPDDLGSHTVCTVVTAEFLEHQKSVGNDLSTPHPQFGFPGLKPGDRWGVCASRWLQAYADGVKAPVVLRATNEAALAIVPVEALTECSADVPDDASELE